MSAVLKDEGGLPLAHKIQWEEGWLTFALGRATEYRMRIASGRLDAGESNAAEWVRQTAVTNAKAHLKRLRAMGWQPPQHLAERLKVEGVL